MKQPDASHMHLPLNVLLQFSVQQLGTCSERCWPPVHGETLLCRKTTETGLRAARGAGERGCRGGELVFFGERGQGRAGLQVREVEVVSPRTRVHDQLT